MSYLAGPLTREQIRVFKPQNTEDRTQTTDNAAQTKVTRSMSAARVPIPDSRPPIAIPSNLPQYFLPANWPMNEAVAQWRENTGNRRAQFGELVTLVYRPVLLAQAVVRYVQTKAQLNTDRRFAFLLETVDGHILPHWRDYEISALETKTLARTLPANAQLRGEVPAPLTDLKKLAAWQKDLVSYLYRTADFSLHQNVPLKLFSHPGQSYAEFLAVCQRAADEKRDAEVQTIRARFDRQLDRLEDKLIVSQRDLKEDQEQLRARESENRWTGIENIVGFVLGYTPYRPMSTAASKSRLVKKARTDITKGEETVERLQAQMETLKHEAQKLFEASQIKWTAVAHDVSELRVTPRRSDILVEIFGLGWLPFWQIDVDGAPMELAARRG
jgi:hypothetical protein